MRPTLSTPPMCRLIELKDGTYDLADVAFMNEVLDVRDENNWRAHESAKAK